MLRNKHVIIIGGGVGGYTTALEVCQRGWQATLIEEDMWGGTCLNRGCVPMKFLLEKVHKREVQDLKAWQQEKDALIREQAYGLQYRLNKAKVRLLNGRAHVIGVKNHVAEVEVIGEDHSIERLTGDYIVIATGAHTVLPDVLQPYVSQIWSVTDLLQAQSLPEEMIIVGAGVSGVECAEYLALLGVKVHLIEQQEQILPGWDIDIAEEVVAYLEEELDVQCYLGCNICQINPTDVGHLLVLEHASGTAVVEAEAVLACTQKAGNAASFSHLPILDDTGSRILVNEQQRTRHPQIYAVGDCTLGSMTAHGAAREARQAVRRMMGEDTYLVHSTCSFVTLDPPAFCAGMTAEQAEREGIVPLVAKSPLYGNAKAAIMQQTQGVIKVIADACDRRILGIHMYGPCADELLSLASFIVEQGSTVEAVEAMAFPHPTIGEYIQEAVKQL